MMRLLLPALAVLLVVTQANAANFSVNYKKSGPENGKNCTIARIDLSGEIETGDLDKLKSAISEIDAKSVELNSSCGVNEGGEPILKYLSLNSPGGSYLEALNILEWMTSDGRTIPTYVDRGNSCYSACATIFLGGMVIGVEDVNFIRRVIHPRAQLGFHAPFPVLEDKNYSDKEVMDYFHTAFLIEHDFFTRAKKLGLSAEVAQYLMQPTIDEFFMIDTAGVALLTRTDVQFSFTFESNSQRPYKLDNNTALNICANNEIIKNNGVPSDLIKFIKWTNDNKIKPSVVPSISVLAPGNIQPNLTYIVPIEYAAEGMYQSCIVKIPATDDRRDFAPNSVPKCMGLFYDDYELGRNIERNGVDNLDGADQSFCSVVGPLAGLHYGRKLADLTPAELGE